MKITRTLAVIAATTVLALTGCSSDEDTSSDSTSTGSSLDSDFGDYESSDESTLDSAEEYGLSDDQIEEGYTSIMRTSMPRAFGPLSDQQILDMGYAICGGFDSGVSFEQGIGIAVDSGYTYDEAGQIIGYTTAALCPEHEDLY